MRSFLSIKSFLVYVGLLYECFPGWDGVHAFVFPEALCSSIVGYCSNFLD